ncbi:AzlD domain-containing protein [Bacillus fonticola]|uniref:AzlD domain-containing protein n=1 Tax=Bacillus fonticola TaxID=2728853 RepID=UPI0014745B5F|nr:AzlD domain-containing protein [Bacillus fonticola]
MAPEMMLLIVAMGLVTYIPRAVPFLVFRGDNLPIFWQNVLRNVPYAALGALIFPGVMTVTGDPLFGLIGAGIAIALAWFGVHVIGVVLGTVLLLSAYAWVFV